VGSLTNSLLTWADVLDAAGQARALAEERFLDGGPVLFPDTADAWDKQLHETWKLAAMALGLSDFEGIEPPSTDEDQLSRLIERMLADLVEWAKATALEKLGDGERGLAIARDWLRPKLDRNDLMAVV
jgi:hypothetical protein